MKLLLNPQQKVAIQTEYGPLLIIAGAGTGKTTVITERIKHLILEKNVKPNQILALTFTEKAASEMEERVDKIMPYGYTSLWISTFHSFCDTLLREEAIHIGLNPNYKLMTESESVLFLKKNLFKLDLDYFRPLGNPTKFLEALLTHFARLSDEDISPDEYLTYAKSLKKEIDKERALEIKKTLELASVYKTYEELKIKEGKLDFSNLISQALWLFRKRNNVLKKYQKQFQYILVDEFQDTNFAQNELAILLSGDKKNITVVADDDQAIYRWRGAALSNVIQFKNNFPGTKVITLTQNYRSTQEILDRSYKLIQFNNPNRLEALEKISKKLQSARSVRGLPPTLIHTHRVDEEAEEIVKKITSIVEKGEYAYKDIAILVRANNHAQSVTQALQRARIPYQFLGPGQLFHQEAVKNLIAYLKVLYNLEDSISLFKILQINIFNLSMRTISAFLSYARKRNLSLFESLEKADEIEIPDGDRQKIKKITQMILRHLERIKKDTAGQILYYFLVDSGLFDTFLSYRTQQDEQIAQNIAKFFDKIKTFETVNEDASVYAVVDWIDLMLEMGDSPLVSEVDWKDINAVNILTIHSSKGLEFPVVFMVNLIVDRFPTRERREKIPLPPNLIKEILPEGDYHMQEERRLFYVGMTRAKNLLFFTAAKFYADGKRERKLSPFILEALPEEHGRQKKLKLQPTQLTLVDVAREYRSRTEQKLTEEHVPFKITHLSYSALQAFDICPLHFKAQYILNLSPPFSAPLSFGISIHSVLKDFYDLRKQNQTPTENDFIDLLRKNWVSEGYQEKLYEKKMFEKGKTVIHNYYKNYFDAKKTPLFTEMPFSFHINKALRITGKIDRIDLLENNHIEIIDYKTGQSDNLSKNAYKLQLGIYALAATKIQDGLLKRRPEEITVTLFYLEEGKKISHHISATELKGIDEHIQKKIKEIESSDFQCSRSVLCINCEYKMLCNVNL